MFPSFKAAGGGRVAEGRAEAALCGPQARRAWLGASPRRTGRCPYPFMVPRRVSCRPRRRRRAKGRARRRGSRVLSTAESPSRGGWRIPLAGAAAASSESKVAKIDFSAAFSLPWTRRRRRPWTADGLGQQASAHGRERCAGFSPMPMLRMKLCIETPAAAKSQRT